MFLVRGKNGQETRLQAGAKIFLLHAHGISQPERVAGECYLVQPLPRSQRITDHLLESATYQEITQPLSQAQRWVGLLSGQLTTEHSSRDVFIADNTGDLLYQISRPSHIHAPVRNGDLKFRRVCAPAFESQRSEYLVHPLYFEFDT